MTLTKYLIIGSKGQLGIEFIKILAGNQSIVIGVDIDELDICNMDSVFNFFKKTKPEIVINCAAFNLVDKAEENPEVAFKVNAEAVENLALASSETKSILVHYSSDYVFDGKKKDLYIESDKANPINKYGESKYLGEQLLFKNYDRSLIFRLSWVFGNGTQNFIYKFLEWGKKSGTLNIASDEISVPTSTLTVVDVTLSALQKELTGLYHLTNTGYISRYGWAKFISDELGLKLNINPVSKDSFNLKAIRPEFSAMSNEKISLELGITIPSWQDAVRKFSKGFHD